MQELTPKQAADWLIQCEDAHILVHRSPDGDCTGGGFALLHMLRQMGKRAAVVCEDGIPERYGFLCPPDAQAAPDFAPQCVISVDVADKKLLGARTEAVYGERVDLCIDHHMSNVPFSPYRCLNGQAAAACEVLYDILQHLPVTLTDAMAACLYTGIATDTGCFQFDNARAATHRAIADLMERCPGVPYAWINRQMFAVKSLGRLRLEQRMVDQLEIYRGGACVLMCITQAFMQQYQVDEAELEGIAGFPLQVAGAEVGITMKEKEPGLFRVSMRSADRVNVAAICQRLGGGGHVKAAGCQVTGTAGAAKRKLLDAIMEGWND